MKKPASKKLAGFFVPQSHDRTIKFILHRMQKGSNLSTRAFFNMAGVERFELPTRAAFVN
ncbi:protein of unknown function [Vibrio tapetis subsp. tapetis]|uniref:Uncharacterized protein n=1 Tax=Vibrio tapetis subsp. tapetis TaxID=1671868 RepID=A0A2N8ZF37_9VIBR|nr:protein of unknown function [Vibrio tapetis subsp. tapetis]